MLLGQILQPAIFNQPRRRFSKPGIVAESSSAINTSLSADQVTFIFDKTFAAKSKSATTPETA